MKSRDLALQASRLPVGEAFKLLTEQQHFGSLESSEAPFFVQEEDSDEKFFEYDFIFKNGDVITYTATQGEPAGEGGSWDFFSYADTLWGKVLPDGTTENHDAFKHDRGETSEIS